MTRTETETQTDPLAARLRALPPEARQAWYEARLVLDAAHHEAREALGRAHEAAAEQLLRALERAA